MNTYISRWKEDLFVVQQKIEALPASRESSGEIDPNDNAERTLSDHASQDQEEIKDGKPDLFTKESVIPSG